MNRITVKGNEVGVAVSVIVFKEGEVYIAYCPSLDLSGYDTTEDKAREDFEFVLDSWLTEQMQNGTLDEDLKRHGWNGGKKGWREPSLIELLNRSNVHGVMARPEYRKINVCREIVC